MVITSAFKVSFFKTCGFIDDEEADGGCADVDLDAPPDNGVGVDVDDEAPLDNGVGVVDDVELEVPVTA